MVNEINLVEYLRLGGKLKNLDLTTARCDYGDKNSNAKILSYEDSGLVGGSNEPLYYFTFDNGNTHRYSLYWIKVKVDVELNNKYNK